jgi:hypothetical protein
VYVLVFDIPNNQLEKGQPQFNIDFHLSTHK